MLSLIKILAMIEEAAGTHMYEVKKQEAERIIERKDMKLANIVDVSFNYYCYSWYEIKNVEFCAFPNI